MKTLVGGDQAPRQPVGAARAPEARRRPGVGGVTASSTPAPLVSVVIPTRRDDCPEVTLRTLYAQTVRDLEIHVVVDHAGRGQSWARNRGAELARGRYLLFSDYDVAWVPTALELLLAALEEARTRDARTAFAYGPYEWTQGGQPVLRLGTVPWDPVALRRGNYVSTMSLIDRATWVAAGLAWDEGLRRLEDWDLWLRMAALGLRGVWVDHVLFRTEIKPGVSWANPLSHAEAERQVRAKHGL